MRTLLIVLFTFTCTGALAQSYTPVWDTSEEELLNHFRELLRFDTRDPPGRELPAAEYIYNTLSFDFNVAIQNLLIRLFLVLIFLS